MIRDICDQKTQLTFPYSFFREGDNILQMGSPVKDFFQRCKNYNVDESPSKRAKIRN